jgi:hypothetical protein
MDNLKPALKGQYHAALDMLRGAIETCPDSLWTGGVPPRSFWRLAYHCLFYAHCYLEVHCDDFTPWEHHRNEAEGYQGEERMDATPYTQAELLTYWEIVDARVDPQIDKIDLSSSESGFYWYKIPKLDHVLLNLRHIMDHSGQLRDRLLEAGIDQKWHTKR